MKSVLFVDDERNVLDGLRRMLSRYRNEWQMGFANGGDEALHSLASSPVDVLVTDMRMPGMNGAQLLSQVAQEYPQIVRIVLSGMFDRELLPLSAYSAHQFLRKPCDADVLKAAITRAFNLKTVLADPNLRSFISTIKTLPSVPSIYLELVNAARNPEVAVTDLSRIISKDLAMSTKVLQLANSPLFGMPRRVLDPTEACVYLGADTIEALVLSAAVFCQYGQAGLSHFSTEDLQAHSLRIAAVAKRLAEAHGSPKRFIEEAMVAGLLHDIGKLVFALHDPRLYDRCIAEGKASGVGALTAEAQFFGVTHAEAGMYLLRLWGLPDVVTEAVAFHHRPREGASHSFGVLDVVYIADTLAHEGDGGAALDLDYVAELGLSSSVPEWRRLCSQVLEG